MLITPVMAGKDKEILCDRGSRAYLSVKSTAEERIKSYSVTTESSREKIINKSVNADRNPG